MTLIRCCLVVLVLSVCRPVDAAPNSSSNESVPMTGKPWIDMNYGPCLTATLEVEKDNIAYKGIAIRLDEGDGGVSKGGAFGVFDTDTLRYAAGWSGESFIDWRNIAFDGSHQTHAAIQGDIAFSNPVAPGWAKPSDEEFLEPRLLGRDGLPYGPMPRDWMHWKGHYLHGSQVILRYTVGRTEVLERPGWSHAHGAMVWSRTFHIGPRDKDMILQVARHGTRRLEMRRSDLPVLANPVVPVFATSRAQNKPAPATGQPLTFDGSLFAELTGAEDFDMTARDFTILARIRTTAGGTILSQAARQGEWIPDGKTFFVRGGRLGYDIGWVGVLQSKTEVNDGQWHDVAMTFTAEDGRVRLYVDGEKDGEKTLQPKAPVRGHVVRIGYTAPNFPEESQLCFEGQMEALQFHHRALSPEEIVSWREAGQDVSKSMAAYDFTESIRDHRLADRSGRGHHAHIVTQATGAGERPPVAAAVLGGTPGTEWLETANGDLRLRIPRGSKPVRLQVVLSPLPNEDEPVIDSFLQAIEGYPAPADLTTLTNGGPARWTKTITTRSRTVGSPVHPYVIEDITEPSPNPYRSWMRLGGFDFFADGQRAAVCTWMGDVWLVGGLGGTFGEFEWKRIATGLFQPLGLKIVNETIYVTCRDQITRLRDLNGDEEIDFYENFNNDAQVTDHFHEFAMDLQTDAEGNFYYAKAARHAKDALVPQHGTLIRVSADGDESEIVARGFRAPNGVCVNGDGTFVLSDQEGHWTPKNRINWVEPGGFYGNMMAYHDGLTPDEAAPPVTWIHNAFDRSPAEQLWVASDQWGPLQGALLNLSYGVGKIHLVLHERVGGIVQGGVVELPMSDFPTGIMRGRFHPGDGQLYVCGLVGWSSNKIKPGGFYRVRYTGRPVHLPVELHARRDGLALTFTGPLDADSAADAGSYAVSRWTYRRTANYGSKDYKLSQPDQEGRDDVEVSGVELSSDGRTVLLKIPDMKPAMQMEIQYRLRAADGKRLSHVIQSTVHGLGD